jgi:hypothetical protein
MTADPAWMTGGLHVALVTCVSSKTGRGRLLCRGGAPHSSMGDSVLLASVRTSKSAAAPDTARKSDLAKSGGR